LGNVAGCEVAAAVMARLPLLPIFECLIRIVQ
jgi:hypothetical protein